jgi:hypothetical protein
MDSLLMDLADHYLTFFLHAIALAQPQHPLKFRKFVGQANHLTLTWPPFHLSGTWLISPVCLSIVTKISAGRILGLI